MFCLFATNLWLRNEQVLLKYVPFCRVNIIVILFVLTSSEARKYCHGEYSIIKNSNDTALWVDYHYSDSPVVFSNPSCLNAKGESVKRICHNGSWIPEATPLCDRVTNNDHCPESFYEYRTFCIAKFDEHMIGNSTLKSKIPTTKNNTKLRTCDKFKSNTIAYTLSESFQLKVENSSRLEKYCNGTSYVVVPFDHRFHLCPENCVPSDLTSEKCFCKVTEAKHNKLARVRDILQKKLLSQLAGSDICRIDSNSPSELCNCYPVITHNFYGYTLNTTNCSIIETKALKNDEIDSPSLSLSFNERKRKLILLIESPKGLSTSKYATVKCYTNAGTDRIRNIRIREIKSRNRHSSKDFLVYDLSLEKYIGEYWCEAFSLNLTKIQSNTILAFKEKAGNDYSLRISIKNPSSHFDYNNEEIRVDSMQRKLSSEIRNVLKVDVRFMEFFVLNLNEADLLLHLTTKTHANISMEYKGVKEKLEKLPDYIKVLSLAVVGYCLPDTTKQESLILHWGLAKIWDRIVPRELCLQDDGIPVMRTCQGDFVSGGSWSQPTGICAKDIKVPDLTKYLHQSLYTNITSNLIDNVTSITYNNSLSFLDIYFYSELIKKVNVSKDQNCTQNVFKIINNLSKMNQTELKTSQTLFNATDTILRLLDKEATKNYFKRNESYSFSDENILIQSVNPFKSNISGLYLLGTMQTPLNEMEVFFLFRNETIKDINPDRIKDLDIAVNVPEDVLKSIEADSGDQSGIQIIFTVFYEDSLFVSSNKKSAGKVVSVIIPGYGTYLNESIPIIVRSSINSKSQCGYWNFGQSLQRKKGEWSSFGGEYSGNFLNNSDLHLCHFSHLTHFALLIVSEHIKIEEGGQEITDFLIDENEWDSYLTIITLIGGALSVFGIIGIYLTAILFSEWRAKDGTQILLNLSTAILSEIIVLQFSGATEFLSNNNCKLVGCLLHYTLLSKLCWMLIYALLQYRRFVKVLGPTPKNLILHSMVFGWGFASIPVILTLIFAPESYTKSTICYLRGLPFYLAISLPVCLVIISNLTIFILVMYNVSTSNIESTTVDHKFSLLQLYLAILLFFVLGLPSVFAITADFVTDDMLKMILLFLFCATGTLQGFILFVFYVLFNDETKQKWRKYFKSNKM